MSEPKFTPGPWVVEESKYPSDNGYYYVKSNNETIGGDVLVFQGVSNIQNAALIAASPEMYAILERLEVLSEECKCYPLIPLGRQIFDIVEAAIKALKKARGEQQ